MCSLLFCQASMWHTRAMLHNITTIASIEYTTITANGECQMGCTLYILRLEDQKSSSALTSWESWRSSHHDYLDSNTKYKQWVMKWLTSLNARLIEKIFPSMLTERWPLTSVRCLAHSSISNNAVILYSSPSICPNTMSTTNPSQLQHCVGSHTDLLGWPAKSPL